MVVQAIELENRGEEEGAKRLLAEAIELDPFNQALAVLAEAWKN